MLIGGPQFCADNGQTQIHPWLHGIHSTVRRLLFGPANPHFTGCVAYRGLIPAERIKSLDVEVNAQMWMGPGKHFITYYVAGKRLLNIVGIAEQNTWTGESWTDQAT